MEENDGIKGLIVFTDDDGWKKIVTNRSESISMWLFPGWLNGKCFMGCDFKCDITVVNTVSASCVQKL